jgi:hypothetical protein
MTGDRTATLDFPVLAGAAIWDVYAAGIEDISWESFNDPVDYPNNLGKSGKVHLVGFVKTGRMATSANHTLTFQTGEVADSSIVLWGSRAGECTVDVTRFDADGVAGTFDCPQITSVAPDKITVHATGTFSVSGQQ